jgi:hypothetical protein
MDFNSAQNEALVKTELDRIFYAAYDGENFPGNATASTSAVFKQDTIDRGAYVEEVFGGAGYFNKTGETAIVPSYTPKVGYKMTSYVSDFTKSLEISKNLFDDGMHGIYDASVRDMGMAARSTQDFNAFGLYRGALTTTLTADGQPLASTVHPLLQGGTESNLLTGNALSSNALNSAIVKLRQQKNQAGITLGHVPRVVLVPTALFTLATQITQSVLVGDTSTNAINVFRSAMGLEVWTSPYLDAVNGGSDTIWFLLSSQHQITRVVRQGLETAFVGWQYSNNRTYKYEANFREMYKVVDWGGTIINN